MDVARSNVAVKLSKKTETETRHPHPLHNDHLSPFRTDETKNKILRTHRSTSTVASSPQVELSKTLKAEWRW